MYYSALLRPDLMQCMVKIAEIPELFTEKTAEFWEKLIEHDIRHIAFYPATHQRIYPNLLSLDQHPEWITISRDTYAAGISYIGLKASGGAIVPTHRCKETAPGRWQVVTQ